MKRVSWNEGLRGTRDRGEETFLAEANAVRATAVLGGFEPRTSDLCKGLSVSNWSNTEAESSYLASTTVAARYGSPLPGGRLWMLVLLTSIDTWWRRRICTHLVGSGQLGRHGRHVLVRRGVMVGSVAGILSLHVRGGEGKDEASSLTGY